ncbi:MAG: DUF6178 family protein [Pseudomonadota bacterium]
MPEHIVFKLSQQQLLTRIIEEPDFVQLIQEVSPGILSKLINHIGLEDAGEIVGLATTEQLKQIFDEDLWKTVQSDTEEAFDSDRFALWLTIMLEVSPEFAVTKIMEMDEDLVTLGLAAQIRVLELDNIAIYLRDTDYSEEADIFEKALADCLSLELDDFLVLASGTQYWDTIATLLVELDHNDHHYLQTLLARICYITTEYIEDNGGLYSIFSASETLASDVSGERDERREQLGFVPRPSALQFLQLAVVSSLEEITDPTTQDPITRMHFRTYDRSNSTPPSTINFDNTSSFETSERERRLRQFQKWLEAEGALPHPEHDQLGSQKQPRKKDSLFVRAIHSLFIENPEAYNLCRVELQYLANVLIAANDDGELKSRPMDAVQAVITVCNEGVEASIAGVTCVEDVDKIRQTKKLISSLGAIRLFRVGWHFRHKL